jgi:peroxin-5
MRNAWATAAGNETGEDFVNQMLARERAMAAEAGMAVGEERAWGDEFGEQLARDDDGYTDEFLNDDNGWLKEYESIMKRADEAQHSTEYPFEPNNPYMFHEDPFMEGHDLLAAGTLSEAVLAFEAACQKDPKAAEHWQFLGTTQAENEKDHLAIIALNVAITLCPTNLHALSALAVSHTNEAHHALALQAIKNWITVNENYPGVAEAVGAWPDEDVEDNIEDHFAAQYLFVNPREHKQITAMYEAALEMNPADVELHKALGVLHNLSNQYDKAAMNFREALKYAPEDEKLWNKLGATLANGNRPQQAVEAYQRALDLCPGFVRAQYNLGVAYSNLNDHMRAARQFVRAIVMQQGGAAGNGDDANPPRSTREIWDMLRMSLNLADKSELVDLTWNHDVRPFLAHFGLEDLAM